MNTSSEEGKQMSIFIALIPVCALVGMLIFNVIVFKDEASFGPNQLALMFAAVITSLMGVLVLKVDYHNLEKNALSAVSGSIQAVLILLVVGALIGVWILCGIVPTMIYYGVQLIHPSVFLPVSFLLCSIVSLSTGSSWSTVGTIGIALIGVGKTLGMPVEMVAGAIVSGAYFGDKLSPLSDTTNLAPAMAGSDLFSHVRHMAVTSIPVWLISLIAFAILGAMYDGHGQDPKQIQEVLTVIGSYFNTSWVLLTLPIAIFVLVYKKVPAVPSLVLGTFIGILFALFFQYDLLVKLQGGTFSFEGTYKIILKTAFAGFSIQTGNEIIDNLFTRGGMKGMLNTVWMIFSAMIFGGAMETTGMLGRIAEGIFRFVHGATSLVASTVATSIFLNITASDQYISIVVTGRMFRPAYKKLGLDPKNLSRTVEDASTVTSPLVPWNSCGAYCSSVMGVATLSYLPFAFFNILSPLFSIIFAAIGLSLAKLKLEETK